jgi:hypothetical protein
MLTIIHRQEIDRDSWNKLVDANGGEIFSTTDYLDAVAKDWCVVTDEAYRYGMVIPYFSRLGVKCCYTPVFQRYTEWLGPTEEKENAKNLVQRTFSKGQMHLKSEHEENQAYVYQYLSPEISCQLTKQAKRMLKKFEDTSFTVEENLNFHSEVLNIISEELPKKVKGMTSQNVAVLEALTKKLEKSGNLALLTVSREMQVHGGIFLVKFGNRLLYLKGAFKPDAKKQGAMYAAMYYAIQRSSVEGLIFDFGGSRAEGVRRFNRQFGGIDHSYERWEWDSSPAWFKATVKMINKWKRRQY